MSKCINYFLKINYFWHISTIYYYKKFNLTITIVKKNLTIFALFTHDWDYEARDEQRRRTLVLDVAVVIRLRLRHFQDHVHLLVGQALACRAERNSLSSEPYATSRMNPNKLWSTDCGDLRVVQYKHNERVTSYSHTVLVSAYCFIHLKPASKHDANCK